LAWLFSGVPVAEKAVGYGTNLPPKTDNFMNKNLSRIPTRSTIALSVLLALSACDSDDDDQIDNTLTGNQTPVENESTVEQRSVAVTLSAAQELPAPSNVPDGASGTAEVSVDDSGVVTATVGVSNLTGPATAVHIHRGFAGATGPVIVGLSSSDGGTTWSVPAGEIRGQIDPGNATQFVIRLENISDSNTLNIASDGSTQPVPLSPGAYIVHRNPSDSPLLLPRDSANAGLEGVAEDGNTEPYPAAVPGAAIFNTPVGADAPGPIGPGAAYEFTVSAVDGDKLSFVTMFIPSNDWFYTPTDADNSLDLFADGQPFSGDVAASDFAIWDAGTEIDEEPGTGIYQVQRQAEPNSGPADPNTQVSSLTGRGQSVSLNGQVLQVTITPQ